MTTQTKLKWFWWQDDKEEAWLRSMAQQGWHLKDIRLLNRYVFESGTPQDMTYRLDWITTTKDYQEYLQLFHDAGWSLRSHMEAGNTFVKKARMELRQKFLQRTTPKLRDTNALLSFSSFSW